MSGIVKAAMLGGIVVFASEFVTEMDFAKDKPQIAKYGGAALAAYVALKLL